MTSPKSPSKKTTWSGARGRMRVLALACLLLPGSTAIAGGKSPKISEDLADAKAGSNLAGGEARSNVNVIIQFTQAPTAQHHQKVLSRGGKLKRELSVVKSGAYSLPGSALADLAADPDVVYISPDREVNGALDNTAAAVNANAAWTQGLDGTGIGVAVIDSGVEDRSDLHTFSSSGTDVKNRIVYQQDFTGSGTTEDMYGHGTHVAGIIALSPYHTLPSSYTRKFSGIAYNSNIVSLKVLDQNGSGTDSNVIAAIQKAVNLKSTYNIRVINLSLGRPVFESYTKDPLCQAVESAWKAGIVVVVAAGNYGRNNSGGISGYGTITAPGNDPYVITVGAMKTEGTLARSDDLIASYSSKGPSLYDHVVKPDLVAPGNQVVSLYDDAGATLPTNYPSTLIQSTYYHGPSSNPYTSTSFYMLSGTSMAAPVVSGAAALLLQKNPNLTPDQVKARMMKTAYKSFPSSSIATDPMTGTQYTSYYDIFTIGAGYLDIQAALSNTDLAPATAGSALSPAVTQDASGNIVLVNGAGVIWGTNLIWGTGVIWGTGIIWGTNVSGQSILWGSSVIWGTSTTQGYSVIWGTGTNGTVDPCGVIWGSGTALVDSMSVLTLGEK